MSGAGIAGRPGDNSNPALLTAAQIRAARRRRFMLLAFAGLALICALVLGSLHTGLTELDLADILRILTGGGSHDENLVLFDFRLVRIVLALLVGAGLSVAGSIFQTVSKNVLASPDLLGVSAGAGIAVMLYTYLTPETKAAGIFVLPFVSLVGAMAAALLIYVLAHQKGQAISPLRMVLIGISITAGINAADMIIAVRLSPEQFHTVNTWMIGSVYGNSWSHVLALLPWLVLIIPVLVLRSHDLNVLRLSDGVAVGLGSPLKRSRLVYLLLAVALSAACVSVSGAIGFVGLICPHLARKLVGPNHQYSLPVAALAGAALLLAADWIARVVIAPQEMLLGIVVALVGAPYFLFILLTSKT